MKISEIIVESTEQGVAEATGDKKFDDMMKRVVKKPTQAQRNAERIRQKKEREAETKAHFANGGGFGPSPADALGIRKGVAEGLSESLVSKIEELGMIGRIEYMGPDYNMPYRATLQDKTTGKVWHSDFNDGKTAEDWLVDTLSKYEQWKNKHQGVAEGTLNELSKDTLKSYAKKAVSDMNASQDKSKAEYSKANAAKDDKDAEKHYDAAKQAKDRTEKRMAGVSGAIKRFNKEGVAEGSKDSAPKMGSKEKKLAQGALKGARDMTAMLGLVRGKDGVARPPESKKKGVAESKYLEETYHDDDEFFEAYGVMEYSDDMINEAEYQGRKVALNKPMRGDVAKFKVFVKDPKTGNVKKVNFGQKGARIKKNNPGRRKNFRARHNCDSPGPKTSARYWSCRKW